MTKEEVDLYVARANRYLGGQHVGFRSCSVATYAPTVIAYDFDTPAHADEFIFNRQIMETKYSLEIDKADSARVLEHR